MSAMMKTRPWAAVVMVAMSWILWTRTTWPDHPKRPPDWSMKSGHKNEAHCKKAIKNKVKKYPGKPFKSPNGWYVMRVGNKLWWREPSKEKRGQSHTIEYLCFPADFAPPLRK
jgi:hypothetical protein